MFIWTLPEWRHLHCELLGHSRVLLLVLQMTCIQLNFSVHRMVSTCTHAPVLVDSLESTVRQIEMSVTLTLVRMGQAAL